MYQSLLCIKMIHECHSLPNLSSASQGQGLCLAHLGIPWVFQDAFSHTVDVPSVLAELSFQFNGSIRTTALCSVLIAPFTTANFLPVVWVSLFVFLTPSLSSPYPRREGQFSSSPQHALPTKRDLQLPLCQHWLHSTPGNYFKRHLPNTPLSGVESGHSVLWTRDAICFLPSLKL